MRYFLNDNEIKKRLLKLLLMFQTICNENNLRFSLAGGTLLGAVRHKGFIPWDDDIDVCMPRPDYDKLLLLIKEEKISLDSVKFCCNYLDKSEYPFLKMIDLDIHIKNNFYSTQNDFLWMDIFPVDGLPSNSIIIKKIYKTASLLRRGIMLTFANDDIGAINNNSLKSRIKPIAIKIARLIGNNRLNNIMFKLSTTFTYSNSELVGNIIWGLHNTAEVMTKERFENYIELCFEGYSFPVMSCWDQYLTNLYGQYLDMPQEEDRINHNILAWEYKGV